MIKPLLDINSAGGRAELAFVELLGTITTRAPAYMHRYGRDRVSSGRRTAPWPSSDTPLCNVLNGPTVFLSGAFRPGRAPSSRCFLFR